ncbi:unnamed protein product, partial [Ixodes persulcatus]
SFSFFFFFDKQDGCLHELSCGQAIQRNNVKKSKNFVTSTMVLRILLRYLLHNEQLVQMLADSYPFRRAAQLTASLILRGKSLGKSAPCSLTAADGSTIELPRRRGEGTSAT